MKINSESSITINNQLTLKMLIMDDSHDYFKLIERNRELLKPWLGWVDDIQSLEDARSDLRRRLESFYQGKRVCYGIYYHKDDYKILVGRITLSNQKGEVNIGYFIDENYQGKGLVTASLQKLIEHGFHHFDIHRFKLLCQPTNLGSNAIAKRLNFNFEGVAKAKEFINGEYVDLNCYALIKDEK